MMQTRREILKAIGLTFVAGATQRLGTFVPDVEIALTAAPADVSILPGAPTQVWRFAGRVLKGPADSLQAIPNSYLGPTIRLARGQNVRIRFSNRLPSPSIVHWHGLDVPEAADGHPRLAVPAGADYVYDFQVTNRAGTYWYHPHPHMQTGPQVYRGLAGLLIVSDEEEGALALPSGAAELTCVLQDRRFDSSNQFIYPTDMMNMETGVIGDRALVNGQIGPTWALATQAYRLRVLNGSNARVYKLAWSDGTPMTVLGSQGGLLERPVTQTFVTMAPGQRLDIWLDLSRRSVGTSLELRSVPFAASDVTMAMGMMGGGRSLPQGAAISLLTLRVTRPITSTARLPERLSTFDRRWPIATGAPVRRIPLTAQMINWTLDGRSFEMDAVSAGETVTAGSTHSWEFVNAGGPMGMQMAHPIHLHGRQFRVVSRTGGDPANTVRDGLIDTGWTDTVLVLPHETVRVQVTFSDHAGLFLYHCHILEHEDMGMMRNFRITH